MRIIIALPGQSIFDVALLYCGDVTFAWQIARTNAIPITTTFETTTTLTIPDDSNNISKVFKQQNIVFSTGILEILWILSGGIWHDDGVWLDDSIWID